MHKTCARSNKIKTQHGKKSGLKASPVDKEILYWKLIAVGEDAELIFSKSGVICKLIILQWKVIRTKIYEQHKLGWISDGHVYKNSVLAF